MTVKIISICNEVAVMKITNYSSESQYRPLCLALPNFFSYIVLLLTTYK